ncbi:MAG: hypothetical protein H6R18_992 [Proteobacteria bacterium]|nr:hypothetical protein [Pseudomonadota bacterium]
MDAIRALWQKWCARFIAMSRRERAMIGIAVLVGIAMVGSTVFVEPARAKTKIVRNSVEKKRNDMKNLNAQFTALQGQLAQDPDTAIKAELEGLRAKLRQISADLTKANDALVPPAEMNIMLERILARQSGLQLVSLRTLPPTSFVERPAESGAPATSTGAPAAAADKPADKPAEKAKEFDIYRHGVEVKLVGSYPDLYGYLAQLELEQKKLLWGEVRLKVIAHPKAEMTLVVYTLSVDKAWLSL